MLPNTGLPNTGLPNTGPAASADYAAFLLRLGLGALFVAHALMKVFVFTVPGTIQFFVSIGYPGFLAPVVIVAEFAGGVLLLLGIASRWTALALVPILIGATLQHVPNGWMFGAPNGGWEFPAFWTLALLVQALLGDGAFALRYTASPPRARVTGPLSPPHQDTPT